MRPNQYNDASRSARSSKNCIIACFNTQDYAEPEMQYEYKCNELLEVWGRPTEESNSLDIDVNDVKGIGMQVVFKTNVKLHARTISWQWAQQFIKTT